MKHLLTNTTMDDILEDPHSYGLPTFEEFAKFPSIWRKSEEEMLALADNGSKMLNKNLVKTIYELDGFRFDTLEALQSAALSQGYKMTELDFAGHILPEAGQKYKILLKFKRKEQRKRKDANSSN